MIKIENTEVFGWKAAIRGMKAKGYRKTANNKYECYVSEHRKFISLGTYNTESEAKEVVFSHRINRFINGVNKYNLNPRNCKIIYDRYAVFSNGMIFNLFGEIMKGMIDRAGYHEVLINGKNHRVHRVVAELFIDNPDKKDCVNHIDGNKLNNTVQNLEWCTHSENTIHSIKLGLQKKNQWGLLKKYRKENVNDFN